MVSRNAAVGCSWCGNCSHTGAVEQRPATAAGNPWYHRHSAGVTGSGTSGSYPPIQPAAGTGRAAVLATATGPFGLAGARYSWLFHDPAAPGSQVKTRCCLGTSDGLAEISVRTMNAIGALGISTLAGARRFDDNALL